MEILCSGGLDTKLCTYHTGSGKFRRHRPKTVYPWPSRSPLSLARSSPPSSSSGSTSGRRTICVMRDDRLDLYGLAPPPPSGGDVDVGVGDDVGPSPPLMDESENGGKIGTVEIESRFNLSCSDVSDDGRFLAVSDASGVMLFSMEYVDDEVDVDGMDVDGEGEKRTTTTAASGRGRIAVPTRVPIPKGMTGSVGCTALKFGPVGSVKVGVGGGSGSGDKENDDDDDEMATENEEGQTPTSSLALICASCDGQIRVLRVVVSSPPSSSSSSSFPSPFFFFPFPPSSPSPPRT